MSESKPVSFIELQLMIIDAEREAEKWRKIASELAETATCKITSHYLKGCPFDCEFRVAMRKQMGIQP